MADAAMRIDVCNDRPRIVREWRCQNEQYRHQSNKIGKSLGDENDDKDGKQLEN